MQDSLSAGFERPGLKWCLWCKVTACGLYRVPMRRKMRLRLPDQGRKVREAWEHFRSHASQRHDSLKSTFPETTSLLHTHRHTHTHTHTHTRDLIFWLCRLESLHVFCIPPCDLTPRRVNSTSAGLFFLTGISVSVIPHYARVSTRNCSSMRDSTTINIISSPLWWYDMIFI